MIAHDGIAADCADPLALHVTTVPVSLPDAVPCSFRSPAHVALNDPLADVPVCSVALHLKSVHVVAVGIAVVDVQVPINDASPVELGAVVEVWLS